jgi:hypothetical protein
METFTLRWSADRSLYFVEPSRGRNVRGFWLGAEKRDFPVPPEMIRNPYSGAMAFDGYWRQWFSMRGFIVQQSDPQLKVPGNAGLVRDYLADAHLVTLEEAHQVAETNRIEAEAAARARGDGGAVSGAGSDVAGKQERDAAAMAAVHDAEEALALVEKSSRQTEDPEAAAGFSSGGRPNRRDRRRGN